jgi:hypothetical protein
MANWGRSGSGGDEVPQTAAGDDAITAEIVRRLSAALVTWMFLVLAFLVAATVVAVTLLMSGKVCVVGSPSHGGGAVGAVTTGGAPVPASAVPGLASTVPAGVTIKSQGQLHAGGATRAAVTGHETGALQAWRAVATRGSAGACRRHVSGSARALAQGLVTGFNAHGLRLEKAIVCCGIAVLSVFSSASAAVNGCLNTSGLYRGSRQAGAVDGTAFGATYDHDLEEACAGKEPGGAAVPGGSRVATRTGNAPASRGGAPGACARQARQ